MYLTPDQAFVDVCRVATRPFVASHSNCRSLCPSPRNLTDDMIRAVAERGGVVGNVPFQAWPGSTNRPGEPARSSGAPSPPVPSRSRKPDGSAPRLRSSSRVRLSELIVDHVLWGYQRGGEDAVGLGGDLDGVDVLPLGLDGVEHYPRIAALLERAGLTSTRVHKVCYGNFARHIQRNPGLTYHVDMVEVGLNAEGNTILTQKS